MSHRPAPRGRASTSASRSTAPTSRSSSTDGGLFLTPRSHRSSSADMGKRRASSRGRLEHETDAIGAGVGSYSRQQTHRRSSATADHRTLRFVAARTANSRAVGNGDGKDAHFFTPTLASGQLTLPADGKAASTGSTGLPLVARCMAAVENTVWIGERDGRLSVFNARDGSLIRRGDPTRNIFPWAIKAVGSRMWVGFSDGIVRIFDGSTGELLREAKEHCGGITAVITSNPVPSNSISTASLHPQTHRAEEKETDVQQALSRSGSESDAEGVREKPRLLVDQASGPIGFKDDVTEEDEEDREGEEGSSHTDLDAHQGTGNTSASATDVAESTNADGTADDEMTPLSEGPATEKVAASILGLRTTVARPRRSFGPADEIIHDEDDQDALSAPPLVIEYVYTASDDGTVVRWDAATQQRLAKYNAHRGGGAKAVVCIDRAIVTGGDDGKLCVWPYDAAASATPTARTLAHAGGVKGLSVSPNGQLWSTGADGCAKVWSVVPTCRPADASAVRLSVSRDPSPEPPAAGATATATAAAEHHHHHGHQRHRGRRSASAEHPRRSVSPLPNPPTSSAIARSGSRSRSPRQALHQQTLGLELTLLKTLEKEHKGPLHSLTAVGGQMWAFSFGTLFAWNTETYALELQERTHTGYATSVECVHQSVVSRVWSCGAEGTVKFWSTESNATALFDGWQQQQQQQRQVLQQRQLLQAPTPSPSPENPSTSESSAPSLPNGNPVHTHDASSGDQEREHFGVGDESASVLLSTRVRELEATIAHEAGGPAEEELKELVRAACRPETPPPSAGDEQVCDDQNVTVGSTGGGDLRHHFHELSAVLGLDTTASDGNASPQRSAPRRPRSENAGPRQEPNSGHRSVEDYRRNVDALQALRSRVDDLLVEKQRALWDAKLHAAFSDEQRDAVRRSEAEADARAIAHKSSVLFAAEAAIAESKIALQAAVDGVKKTIDSIAVCTDQHEVTGLVFHEQQRNSSDNVCDEPPVQGEEVLPNDAQIRLHTLPASEVSLRDRCTVARAAAFDALPADSSSITQSSSESSTRPTPAENITDQQITDDGAVQRQKVASTSIGGGLIVQRAALARDSMYRSLRRRYESIVEGRDPRGLTSRLSAIEADITARTAVISDAIDAAEGRAPFTPSPVRQRGSPGRRSRSPISLSGHLSPRALALISSPNRGAGDHSGDLHVAAIDQNASESRLAGRHDESPSRILAGPTMSFLAFPAARIPDSLLAELASLPNAVPVRSVDDLGGHHAGCSPAASLLLPPLGTLTAAHQRIVNEAARLAFADTPANAHENDDPSDRRTRHYQGADDQVEESKPVDQSSSRDVPKMADLAAAVTATITAHWAVVQDSISSIPAATEDLQKRLANLAQVPKDDEGHKQRPPPHEDNNDECASPQFVEVGSDGGSASCPSSTVHDALRALDLAGPLSPDDDGVDVEDFEGLDLAELRGRCGELARLLQDRDDEIEVLGLELHSAETQRAEFEERTIEAEGQLDAAIRAAEAATARADAATAEQLEFEDFAAELQADAVAQEDHLRSTSRERSLGVVVQDDVPDSTTPSNSADVPFGAEDVRGKTARSLERWDSERPSALQSGGAVDWDELDDVSLAALAETLEQRRVNLERDLRVRRQGTGLLHRHFFGKGVAVESPTRRSPSYSHFGPPVRGHSQPIVSPKRQQRGRSPRTSTPFDAAAAASTPAIAAATATAFPSIQPRGFDDMAKPISSLARALARKLRPNDDIILVENGGKTESSVVASPVSAVTPAATPEPSFMGASPSRADRGTLMAQVRRLRMQCGALERQLSTARDRSPFRSRRGQHGQAHTPTAESTPTSTPTSQNAPAQTEAPELSVVAVTPAPRADEAPPSIESVPVASDVTHEARRSLGITDVVPVDGAEAEPTVATRDEAPQRERSVGEGRPALRVIARVTARSVSPTARPSDTRSVKSAGRSSTATVLRGVKHQHVHQHGDQRPRSASWRSASASSRIVTAHCSRSPSAVRGFDDETGSTHHSRKSSTTSPPLPQKSPSRSRSRSSSSKKDPESYSVARPHDHVTHVQCEYVPMDVLERLITLEMRINHAMATAEAHGCVPSLSAGASKQTTAAIQQQDLQQPHEQPSQQLHQRMGLETGVLTEASIPGRDVRHSFGDRFSMPRSTSRSRSATSTSMTKPYEGVSFPLPPQQEVMRTDTPYDDVLVMSEPLIKVTTAELSSRFRFGADANSFSHSRGPRSHHHVVRASPSHMLDHYLPMIEHSLPPVVHPDPFRDVVMIRRVTEARDDSGNSGGADPSLAMMSPIERTQPILSPPTTQVEQNPSEPVPDPDRGLSLEEARVRIASCAVRLAAAETALEKVYEDKAQSRKEDLNVTPTETPCVTEEHITKENKEAASDHSADDAAMALPTQACRSSDDFPWLISLLRAVADDKASGHGTTAVVTADDDTVDTMTATSTESGGVMGIKPSKPKRSKAKQHVAMLGGPSTPTRNNTSAASTFSAAAGADSPAPGVPEGAASFVAMQRALTVVRAKVDAMCASAVSAAQPQTQLGQLPPPAANQPPLPLPPAPPVGGSDTPEKGQSRSSSGRRARRTQNKKLKEQLLQGGSAASSGPPTPTGAAARDAPASGAGSPTNPAVPLSPLANVMAMKAATPEVSKATVDAAMRTLAVGLGLDGGAAFVPHSALSAPSTPAPQQSNYERSKVELAAARIDLERVKAIIRELETAGPGGAPPVIRNLEAEELARQDTEHALADLQQQHSTQFDDAMTAQAREHYLETKEAVCSAKAEVAVTMTLRMEDMHRRVALEIEELNWQLITAKGSAIFGPQEAALNHGSDQVKNGSVTTAELEALKKQLSDKDEDLASLANQHSTQFDDAMSAQAREHYAESEAAKKAAMVEVAMSMTLRMEDMHRRGAMEIEELSWQLIITQASSVIGAAVPENGPEFEAMRKQLSEKDEDLASLANQHSTQFDDAMTAQAREHYEESERSKKAAMAEVALSMTLRMEDMHRRGAMEIEELSWQLIIAQAAECDIKAALNNAAPAGATLEVEELRRQLSDKDEDLASLANQHSTQFDDAMTAQAREHYEESERAKKAAMAEVALSMTTRMEDMHRRAAMEIEDLNWQLITEQQVSEFAAAEGEVGALLGADELEMRHERELADLEAQHSTQFDDAMTAQAREHHADTQRAKKAAMAEVARSLTMRMEDMHRRSTMELEHIAFQLVIKDEELAFLRLRDRQMVSGTIDLCVEEMSFSKSLPSLRDRAAAQHSTAREEAVMPSPMATSSSAVVTALLLTYVEQLEEANRDRIWEGQYLRWKLLDSEARHRGLTRESDRLPPLAASSGSHAAPTQVSPGKEEVYNVSVDSAMSAQLGLSPLQQARSEVALLKQQLARADQACPSPEAVRQEKDREEAVAVQVEFLQEKCVALEAQLNALDQSAVEATYRDFTVKELEAELTSTSQDLKDVRAREQVLLGGAKDAVVTLLKKRVAELEAEKAEAKTAAVETAAPQVMGVAEALAAIQSKRREANGEVSRALISTVEAELPTPRISAARRLQDKTIVERYKQAREEEITAFTNRRHQFEKENLAEISKIRDLTEQIELDMISALEARHGASTSSADGKSSGARASHGDRSASNPHSLASSAVVVAVPTESAAFVAKLKALAFSLETRPAMIRAVYEVHKLLAVTSKTVEQHKKLAMARQPTRPEAMERYDLALGEVSAVRDGTKWVLGTLCSPTELQHLGAPSGQFTNDGKKSTWRDINPPHLHHKPSSGAAPTAAPLGGVFGHHGSTAAAAAGTATAPATAPLAPPAPAPSSGRSRAITPPPSTSAPRRGSGSRLSSTATPPTAPPARTSSLQRTGTGLRSGSSARSASTLGSSPTARSSSANRSSSTLHSSVPRSSTGGSGSIPRSSSGSRPPPAAIAPTKTAATLGTMRSSSGHRPVASALQSSVRRTVRTASPADIPRSSSTAAKR